MLKEYTTKRGDPFSIGKASTCTFITELCGDRSVVKSLFLQICQSIPVYSAILQKRMTSALIQLRMQSSLINHGIYLPILGYLDVTPQSLRLDSDGNFAHFTREFIQLSP